MRCSRLYDKLCNVVLKFGDKDDRNCNISDHVGI